MVFKASKWAEIGGCTVSPMEFFPSDSSVESSSSFHRLLRGRHHVQLEWFKNAGADQPGLMPTSSATRLAKSRIALKNEGCQEPALRSGREAPSSSGRRRRRAARRTRRSVSIAPPKAGRGTECARPELSICGACAAPRQGSSPEWAETRAEMLANYGGSARLRAPRA
jgi:hypothetical protein